MCVSNMLFFLPFREQFSLQNGQKIKGGTGGKRRTKWRLEPRVSYAAIGITRAGGVKGLKDSSGCICMRGSYRERARGQIVGKQSRRMRDR